MFYRSGHGIFRMFFLHLQALVRYTRRISGSYSFAILQYNVFSLIFSWFALANIWLTFSIIIDLLPSQGVVIFGTADIVSFGFTFEKIQA
jgi:chitin synthase